jgi:hypothetical protein
MPDDQAPSLGISPPACLFRRQRLVITTAQSSSNAIPRWAGQSRVEWHSIAPAKTIQKAFITSFHGRLRDKLLDERP